MTPLFYNEHPNELYQAFKLENERLSKSTNTQFKMKCKQIRCSGSILSVCNMNFNILVFKGRYLKIASVFIPTVIETSITFFKNKK